MRRFNIKTFYGSYGKIEEQADGTYSLELIWNGYIPQKPYRKTYKTLKGAKIALGRMTEVYTLTECK